MGVTRKELYALQRALLRHGYLPPNVHQVFKYLLSWYGKPLRDVYEVDIAQAVWYHLPSRMFNVTQLQRLASPQNLRACITEHRVTCNHFAEVRGSYELEGCYVPMVLLPAFVDGLGLTVHDLPSPSLEFPAFDPADFSQVLHHGRVVLARRGLVAYATIVRSGDQCCWHDLPKVGMNLRLPIASSPHTLETLRSCRSYHMVVTTHDQSTGRALLRTIEMNMFRNPKAGGSFSRPKAQLQQLLPPTDQPTAVLVQGSTGQSIHLSNLRC